MKITAPLILLTLSFTMTVSATSSLSQKLIERLEWQTYSNCNVSTAEVNDNTVTIKIYESENNESIEYQMDIKEVYHSTFFNKVSTKFKAVDGGILSFQSNKNAPLSFTLKYPTSKKYKKVLCKTYCYNKCE